MGYPSLIQTSQLRYYIKFSISKARRQYFYSLASIPCHSRHHNEAILLISNKTLTNHNEPIIMRLFKYLNENLNIISYF